MHNTFTRLLKIELKKAIKNKFFLITLLTASLFALLSAWYRIDSYFYFYHGGPNLMITGNPMIEASSLFNHWIGGEGFSLGFTLFFTLLPLIAALPYGWSYFIENKSGYVKTVVTRCSKCHYYLSKYLATFTAGGLVVLIPLLVNFLLVACFVPAITPSTEYILYYPVLHGSLWSQLFFTHPVIFVILYLILDFIFAGLFATMSLAITFFIKNRIAVILIPYLLIMILHYSRTFLTYKFYYEISPLHFLHSTSIVNPTNVWIILGQGLLFFVLTFGITMKLGVKREVY
ncbi:hypothetical protein [Bacillus niameyensis]|uniref:hypothetical protein n=1 Tax=Bacillus niameyensis TaxID=1522308 RepID=UPI0007824FF3|nr:hypothetical protein [Bacillus niameyensis]